MGSGREQRGQATRTRGGRASALCTGGYDGLFRHLAIPPANPMLIIEIIGYHMGRRPYFRAWGRRWLRGASRPQPSPPDAAAEEEPCRDGQGRETKLPCSAQPTPGQQSNTSTATKTGSKGRAHQRAAAWRRQGVLGTRFEQSMRSQVGTVRLSPLLSVRPPFSPGAASGGPTSGLRSPPP